MLMPAPVRHKSVCDAPTLRTFTNGSNDDAASSSILNTVSVVAFGSNSSVAKRFAVPKPSRPNIGDFHNVCKSSSPERTPSSILVAHSVPLPDSRHVVYWLRIIDGALSRIAPASFAKSPNASSNCDFQWL